MNENILYRNEGKLKKNHFIFIKNNITYFENIDGDERLNIFKKDLMNIYLGKFEEHIGNVVYDDIIRISTIENRDDIIENLPKHLKSLSIRSSMCRNIILAPTVKQSIEYLHIDHSNICIIPDIEGCNKLVSLKINHSNISEFSIELLPSSLSELNLSNNVITNNLFAYNCLINKIHDNTLKNINFTDNYLDYNKFPEILQRKVKLIRQGTYKFNKIDFRNVGVAHIHNFMTYDTAAPKTTILHSTQTVHLSSINTSVINSIEVIKEFITSNDISIISLKDVNFKYLKYIKSYIKSLILNNKYEADSSIETFNYFIDNYNTYELKQDFITPTKHSITNLTYLNTFELVWSVIYFKINKENYKADDLFERISTELADSYEMCFTGKYNRLINVLVGILDGIKVGISSKEEIQLEFGKIIERLNDKRLTYDFSNAICDANKIFANVNKSAESEKSIWMTALYDLAPEPTKIIYNQETYYQTWDSIILDCYYKSQVGLYCEQSKQIIFCTQDLESGDVEVSDNKVSDNKVSDNKVSDNKVSDNKVSDNKVSDNKVSDYDYEVVFLSDDEEFDEEIDTFLN